MKRLRRFDLTSADFDHAMIRVGDSAQMVVVAENLSTFYMNLGAINTIILFRFLFIFICQIYLGALFYLKLNAMCRQIIWIVGLSWS